MLSGKERNQERIINQAVYDHNKTKSDRVSGPRNKGKYPGKFDGMPTKSILLDSLSAKLGYLLHLYYIYLILQYILKPICF